MTSVICFTTFDRPESLLSFVDTCRGVDTPWNGCDARVGASVVATIDAMYRSANSGLLVDVK